MARLIRQKAMNRVISHLPEVVIEVAATADEIGAKAEAKLAQHFKTGEHRIEVEHHKVDSVVVMEGEAAVSVEFGHTHNRSGRHVNGLYIVTGAAGLI